MEDIQNEMTEQDLKKESLEHDSKKKLPEYDSKKKKKKKLKFKNPFEKLPHSVKPANQPRKCTVFENVANIKKNILHLKATK